MTQTMKNGRYSLFLDNERHGDDVVFSRRLGPYSILDVVLDGVTRGKGREGSRVTSEILREGSIETPEQLGNLLRDANNQLSIPHLTGETTATTALKIDDQLYVLNTGDSPAYLYREGNLMELTTLDKHSFYPAVITNCVGNGLDFDYHTRHITLCPGDRIALFSDGVTDNLHREEIYDVLCQERTPWEAVSGFKALLQEKREKNEGREFGRFKYDDVSLLVRYFSKRS